MLVFAVQRSHLAQNFSDSPLGLEQAQSYIHPLQHPMLEHGIWRTEGKTALVVRERGRVPLASMQVEPAMFRRMLRKALQWPLQYAVLVIDHHTGTMQVQQNPLWGVAPVYLVEKGDMLHGHWDPFRLYPLLDEVHMGRAARFLHQFNMPYGRQTIFPSLKMLTAGAVARWGRGKALTIHYPLPVAPFAVRKLKDGADVVATANLILSQSVKRWLHDDVVYGAELSGGLDSALVSITVGKARKSLRTFGIALPQTDGQAERRNAVTGRFGFHDTYIDLQDNLPFGPASPRWQARKTAPWEETYEEAVTVLLEKAAAQGVQAMFTGFGGDELCPVYPSEPATPPELAVFEPASEQVIEADFLTPAALAELKRSPMDMAPQAGIDASSLETAAFGSALYLRHGIWPIHPLCTPELVRFCLCLPWQWRVGRGVERQMLKALDCPSAIYECRTVDSFLNALASGLRTASQKQVLQLFKAPKMAKLGLVQPKKLQSQFLSWCERGADEDVIPFYSAIALERALQDIGEKA